jgi:hypothetical protein
MLGNFITYRSPNTELTVADILREHLDDYREAYPMTAKQNQVAEAIMACRTPQLGGRIDQCNECGAWVFRFNSCRDRHCNQCQKYERVKWVEKQQVRLLPIPYFHIVFTVDHALKALIRQNQREFYDLLFQVFKQTLQQFAREKLGCELGITAVLHTWGQQLGQHVHIHCIVTGGGLALDQSRWVRPINKRYLFEVVELSAAYRDALIESLRRKYQQQRWHLSGPTRGVDVEALLKEIQAKKWEVFIKPFEQPEAVYEYLSRYVHQVAISNYRLVKLAAGQVTFRYYDNQERAEVGGQGQEKERTLPATEFIRRLMLHVLPPNYHRIRYFGLHSSTARAEKLPRARQLLGLDSALPEIEELTLREWLQQILGDEVDRCPNCGATGSLFERTTFKELPWLITMILVLCGQPTTQGVCR